MNNIRLMKPYISFDDIEADFRGVFESGMFTRGEFDLGQRPALTLPQSAVLLREGFAYVRYSIFPHS